jgi:acyl-coenzyme A synthetase/AMP-(fatty) acid ligase/aryl carrier-like protein
VIYTSGSTGRPKGVMVEHRNLNHYLTWAMRSYPVDHQVGALLHSPIVFDMAVTTLFLPLLCGSTLRLTPEGGVPGADILASLRETDGIGLLKVTPTHLDLLAGQADPGTLACQVLVVGGEALRSDTIRAWQSVARGSTTVVNEYGPTEAAVGCCVHVVTGDDTATGSVPIGRPITNTSLYLLDQQGRPVPDGAVGELFIGGGGVARGYVNRPAATAEVFVPNPFGPGRLYRTGDLARRLPGGALDYLGRADHQVKIRGYRVEPGEVETTLRTHPAVRAAAVVADRDRGTLAAFVVVDRPEPTSARLRQHVADLLPAYLVPASIDFLPELPTTTTGKVDRASLRPRKQDRGTHRPLDTDAERALGRIWQDLLAVTEVGADDDFFALGGHSVLAMRLVHRIDREFGVRLDLGTVFDEPTIRALCARISQVEMVRIRELFTAN